MIDKNQQIELGQHLFTYSSPFFIEYEIVEIQKLATKNNERIFYIAKCLDCNNHDNCLVAYSLNEQGQLSYSHMENNNEEYYWHHSKPKHIFRTKKEALIYVYNERIAKYKEDIEKYKKNIAFQEKEMADCINTRDSLINGE
mgnify:CR=1 FL=1